MKVFRSKIKILHPYVMNKFFISLQPIFYPYGMVWRICKSFYKLFPIVGLQEGSISAGDESYFLESLRYIDFVAHNCFNTVCKVISLTFQKQIILFILH